MQQPTDQSRSSRIACATIISEKCKRAFVKRLLWMDTKKHFYCNYYDCFACDADVAIVVAGDDNDYDGHDHDDDDDDDNGSDGNQNYDIW